MEKSKLQQQINFIIEVDKLKNIFRQSYISDATRHENDAEHSWHLALMVIILREYFDENADELQVIKMVLIHDLVEIYAGDTYLYDVKGNETKAAREQEAADKLFAMLPEEQCKEFMDLWHEFENKTTVEAKFAATLDRLQPVLLNYITKGKAWIEHGVNKEQVLKRQADILNGPEEIADYLIELLNDAENKDYLGK
jgi:putative hydrolase of HD superfamily